MKFIPTPLPGNFTIDLELKGDERGFFARAFCEKEFAAAGLETRFVQANTAFTKKKGTFRGFHYQLPPSAEVKVVRCVRGAILDVVVDMRAGSPTFKKWFGAELTQDNRSMMYVPRGFAHGLMTLTDDVEVHYWVSSFYDAEAERGVRFNDPQVNVTWPLDMAEISAKDASWPDFDDEWHGTGLFT